MASSTRLKQIETQLTAKQLVMLDIQEARRFPDIAAYARALAAGEASGGGTLSDRIEAAVLRSSGGARKEKMMGRIREAQKEGYFLTSLAFDCNHDIAAMDTELRMTSALIASQLLLITWSREAENRLSERFAIGWTLAERHLEKLSGLIDGTRLIEREYFDGQPVLFPAIESLVIELRESAEMFVEAFQAAAEDRAESDDAQRGNPTAGLRDRTELDAGQRAAAWVMMARAKTHRWMGEEGAGMNLARQLLGEG